MAEVVSKPKISKELKELAHGISVNGAKIGMSLKIIEAEACGNTFLIIDEQNVSLDSDSRSKIAIELGKKSGKDDFLFISPLKDGVVRMRIIDRDGLEGDMCGNGSRCVAKYLIDHIQYTSPITLETNAGMKKVSKVGKDLFNVEMGNPKMDKELWNTTVSVDGADFKAFFINTGEPHAVILVDDISKLDVNVLGKAISADKKFEGKLGGDPNLENGGPNVTFVQIVDSTTIKIRTYERGCKRETLACGTGATAAAIVAIEENTVGSGAVSVSCKGGSLKVSYTPESTILEGEAHISEPIILNVKDPSILIEPRK